MPNHVFNILKFNRLTPEDKDFILKNFTTEYEDDIYPLNLGFDFDKIIPEPKTESECPDEYKVNKDSHISTIAEKTWFDWYKWRLDHWSTKWNCYNNSIRIGKTTIIFIFQTAWSAPRQVYEQLRIKYPNLFWEVRYADEDWGNNCGIITYDPTKTGFMAPVYIHEDDMKNPRQFARRIWENY